MSVTYGHSSFWSQWIFWHQFWALFILKLSCKIFWTIYLPVFLNSLTVLIHRMIFRLFQCFHYILWFVDNQGVDLCMSSLPFINLLTHPKTWVCDKHSFLFTSCLKYNISVMDFPSWTRNFTLTCEISTLTLSNFLTQTDTHYYSNKSCGSELALPHSYQNAKHIEYSNSTCHHYQASRINIMGILKSVQLLSSQTCILLFSHILSIFTWQICNQPKKIKTFWCPSK